VPPFRPFFSPQPRVFSRSLQAISPLSTVFAVNPSLTPLSTAFTQIHRGVGVLEGATFPDLQTFKTFPPSDAILSALCFHNLTNLFHIHTEPKVSPSFSCSVSQHLPWRFNFFALSRSCELLFRRTFGGEALYFHNDPNCPGYGALFAFARNSALATFRTFRGSCDFSFVSARVIVLARKGDI
jgi:hypothetical protein